RAAKAGLYSPRHRVIPTNTFDAHRLSALALRAGVQDAVVEGLFDAYFVQGEHIGDHDVLTRIGVDGGLPEDIVREVLAGDDGAQAVRDDIETASGFGTQ